MPLTPELLAFGLVGFLIKNKKGKIDQSGI